MIGIETSGPRRRRGKDVVDGHIGRRMRERRRMLGLSQAQLATRMGFTPPQINRYEHGATRLSAAALWRAAAALEVTPGYFYEGLETVTPAADAEEVEAVTAKIVQYVRRLPPPIREKLLAFISTIARA